VSVVPSSYLRSGELAESAGISTDTFASLRTHEVLPAPRRSAGNYRLYPRDAVDRVRLIRRALAVGFSLPELAKILKVRDRGWRALRRREATARREIDRPGRTDCRTASHAGPLARSPDRLEGTIGPDA